MSGGAFFDTNVPLYLLSADTVRCARAVDLLAEGGTISVQVLNEFAAVARRKHAAIVASAIEAGCSILYTQDLQHGQKLEGLTVLDPFR